jgi:hypothetical protein
MSATTLELPTLSGFNAIEVFAVQFEQFLSEVENWDTLTEERREVFTGLAYKLLEHPSDIKSHVTAAVGRGVIGAAKLTKNDLLERFQIATYNFIRVTLDQIERNHPQYQTDLETALQSAMAEIDSGNEVVLTTEEEIRAYLRKTREP